MWRFIQGLPRAVRCQWGTSVRSAPAVLEEEKEGVKVQLEHGPLLVAARHVHCKSASGRYQEHSGHDHQHHYHHGSSHQGQEPDWHEWLRSFRRDCGCFGHPQGVLEAVGLGTVLLLGVQLTHLWHGHYDHRPHDENAASPCLKQQLYRLAHSMPGYYNSVQRSVMPNLSHDLSLGMPQDLSHDAKGSSIAGHQEVWDTGQKSQIQEVRENEAAATFDDWREDSNVLWDLSGASRASGIPHPEQNLQIEADETKSPLQCDASESSGSDPEIDAFHEATAEWQKLTQLYRGAAANMIAMDHAESGDYKLAVEMWRKAALDEGYSKAHYNLGLCYELGRGVVCDLGQATNHYRMAANQGHPRALYNLGVMYLRGQGGLAKDPQAALGLLEQAAHHGLKKAQTSVGVLYTEDERKDMTKAASYFKMAADQNDSAGQYFLGICYENGWGVDENSCRATELYRRAAEQGHPQAQYNLGVCFLHGVGGLPEDQKAALEWFQAASGAGHVLACRQADILHEQVDTMLHYNEGVGTLELSSRGTSEGSSRQESVSAPSLTDYLRHHLMDFGFSDPHAEGMINQKIVQKIPSVKLSTKNAHTKKLNKTPNREMSLSDSVKFYIGDEFDEETKLDLSAFSAASNDTNSEVLSFREKTLANIGNSAMQNCTSLHKTSTSDSGYLSSFAGGSFGNIPQSKSVASLGKDSQTSFSSLNGGSFGTIAFTRKPSNSEVSCAAQQGSSVHETTKTDFA